MSYTLTLTHSLLIIFILLAISLPVAIAESDPQPSQADDQAQAKQDIQAIVDSNNAFAWAMYAKLAEDDNACNLFFSPSSVHTALTMTYAGARGQTAEQMADVLELPWDEIPVELYDAKSGEVVSFAMHKAYWGPKEINEVYHVFMGQLAPADDVGYQLYIANSLWGQQGYPWRQDLLDELQENFGAGLEQVDFAGDHEAARQEINYWVEQQTNEKIKDLLTDGTIDSTTRLVLANAIYLKGDWDNPFDADATIDGPFKLSADETVDVPMMRQTEDLGYTETDDAQLLRMPYSGNELSMIVILPKAVDGLADVEAKLADTGLTDLSEPMFSRTVAVTLPKFTMTSQFSLADVLQAMGMTDAFTPAADFSGLSDQALDDKLAISAVVHKAFVEVNEEGTEAAAATGVAIRLTATPTPPVQFIADHPFVFVIRHEATGTILFIGRVMNPVNNDD